MAYPLIRCHASNFRGGRASDCPALCRLLLRLLNTYAVQTANSSPPKKVPATVTHVEGLTSVVQMMSRQRQRYTDMYTMQYTMMQLLNILLFFAFITSLPQSHACAAHNTHRA